MVLRRDHGRTPRIRTRNNAAGTPTLGDRALHSRSPNATGTGGLARAHAAINGSEHRHTDGDRIGLHTTQHLQGSSDLLASHPGQQTTARAQSLPCDLGAGGCHSQSPGSARGGALGWTGGSWGLDDGGPPLTRRPPRDLVGNRARLRPVWSGQDDADHRGDH